MQVKRISTNTPLDSILDNGIECGVITNLYGPPGSGKTNICLSTMLQADGKVLYIDTEGSFSLDRFKQLGGNEKILDNIIFIDIHNWKDQYENALKIDRIIQKDRIALIVIDSLVALYRLELDVNDKEIASRINRQLGTIYSIFSRLARERNIPVLVTNQVYGSGDDIEPTSKAIARYWSKCLIELKLLNKENCRKAIIRKHRSIAEGKSVDLEITQKGMKELKGFFR
ncbi:MAG: DNA repair and recombination protein RadB [Candidatus Aenigmarchaeota archaeon]|nr:DNA repair and recombination protein RadB [Candidatus Aenigmarchaeota archaeon]